MNLLEAKLLRQVRLTGPISVADYMSQCLFDPEHGYYTAREPFGAAGGFTTAPEISQMFGEVLGAWWVSARQILGLGSLNLVEIGPGRGTLMDDMLRTIGKLSGNVLPETHMVEVSQRLAELQKEKLTRHPADITWHASAASLPKKPLGIIANELFDAIPMRQFIKTGDAWLERMVRHEEAGGLGFCLGTATLSPDMLPPGHAAQPDGQIVEYAPARIAMLQILASHIKEHGGFALFIDYGHAKSGFGDTFQAVRTHQYAKLFDRPGETDLTSHVDFEALAAAARSLGVHASSIIEQGDFLRGAGIMERAAILRAKAPEDIDYALARLISRDKMGGLFKVLALSSSPNDLPPLNFAH